MNINETLNHDFYHKFQTNNLTNKTEQTKQQPENTCFISSMSTLQEFFASKGYLGASNLCQSAIDKFKQGEPNESQNQLLLKLQNTELALDNFAEKMYKKLNAIDPSRAAQIFEQINKLSGFVKTKETIQSQTEIENFILQSEALIKLGSLIL